VAAESEVTWRCTWAAAAVRNKRIARHERRAVHRLRLPRVRASNQ
jgi:hypothetical protein